MAAEMEKAWRPQEVEREMYAAWEAAGLFTADPADPRPHFSIVLPPPNVTGELHMGHATNHTLQDIYSRFKRMQGFEVLWLPGTDHAAIATQNVIERQLTSEGTTKERIGRDEFGRRVEQWYAEYGARILDQERRLGITCDWTRLRFTMDPAYVGAVRTAFVRLYEKGYIYRGPRIVNWCPRCRSSISDLEVEWREQEAVLYHIRYDMADGDGAAVVATVRPETMLADAAIAVNPADDRYRHFIGRRARLPLVGRELPIIGDDYVKIDFGSGALKVTPGHDPNDYEIGRRHELPIYSCIDKDGLIVAEDWVPDELRSLDALDARRRIVDLLRESDHLVKTEAYAHEVGHCDRCGHLIEPLVDEQWWCAMAEMARPAIEVVERGDIQFVPARWTGPYLNWMRNLRDWNVSRQLWLGHRLPIYYCDAGHGDHVAMRPGGFEPGLEGSGAVDAPQLVSETYAFASIEEPTHCPVCGATALRQDTDVLDTWFSSALWPFATMGWPDRDSPDLKAFHPTGLLGTDRGIIYLWVARMIMTDLEFLDRIPFDTVLIHATIQDAEGRRMSKSKGTGVDPLGLIDRYGADAVRAWCGEVGLGRQDVRFDEQRVDAFARFANKLWNITRLVLGAADGVALVPAAELKPEEAIDRWILSRLDRLTAEVTGAIEGFSPGDGVTAIYEFAWHELADWYLEAAKARFRAAPDTPGRVMAVSVAMTVVDRLVRLLHPYMPFVTEALWKRLPASVGRDPAQALIARSPGTWPAPLGHGDQDLDRAFEALVEVVRALRDARKEARVGERERVVVAAKRVAGDPAAELLDSAAGRSLVSTLALVDLVAVLEGTAARTLVAGGLELSLAAASPGEVDRSGLDRQLVQAREQIASVRARLNDSKFTDRAPEAVVAKQRKQLEGLEERERAIQDALARAAG
ncbi:MAG: valine--tRNA ligase [Candidatus Dormibacteria bacterium]